jgi:hypothetical protein
MSLPILKRDAPTDLLAQMKQIEERCNKWQAISRCSGGLATSPRGAL